jgi:UDP-N-acetyl-2-amino-2-deoxyglucuronate dehydrogenase
MNPSDKPLRLGLIGCGVIGRKHLEAARALEGAGIVGIADLDRKRLEEVASFGIPLATTRADDLIDDPEIDGIVVALPTGVRTPIARQVLSAKKHLLVEKPVAMNAGEVEDLIALQGDRVAACCSCRFRFMAAAALARDAISAGEIGRLRSIRIEALSPPPATRPDHPPPWRLSRRLNGGGILLNWGSYDLDFMLGALDWTFTPLTATARTFPVPTPYADWIAPGSDAETHVIAQVHGANGIVIDYERAEFHPGKPAFNWSFSGDRGSLTLNPGDNPVELTLVRTGDDGALQITTLNRETLDHDRLHAGPITDFARSIRTGRAPMTPLNRALTIARITDAIYASVASGGRQQRV